MAKKTPWKSAVTDIVEFSWPHLNKADDFFVRNAKVEEGKNPQKAKYHVTAVMTEAQAKALKQSFRAYAVEAYGPDVGKKAKLPTFKEDEDTGNWTVKFDTANRPGIFDSAGNVLPPSVWVNGGTKGRIGFTMRTYDPKKPGSGVIAMLDAVMVTELVEYKRDSEQSGKAAFKDFFGKSEGYTYSGPQEEPGEEDDEDAPAPKAAKRTAQSKLDDEEDELDSLGGGDEDDLASL